MTDIHDAKVLIVATHGFEQSELEVPRNRLDACCETVHVATTDGAAIKGWDKDDWGREVPADLSIDEVRAVDYDAIVLPGGQINPDLLRVQKPVLDLIRDFHDQGRVVAAICHAPWLLIEAGIVEGRDMTSYASIQTDLKNAGANWHDKEVVTDNGIVTSRSPDDLDAFVAKIIEEIGEGRHTRKAA
ncbi:MAG TPA: protease [Rhodobacteraceae bacterium]|jgi:protease I|nr:protease [Paracoccaceae bacterium]